MKKVVVPAFAKINLCLHVLGKRADGYHELRTLFQTISLRDDLELRSTQGTDIQLECDHPSLPPGPENLVWRGIEAMRKELNLRRGVRAVLTKRIPIARGLGGGSSDAAAALVGMLKLTGRSLPLARLTGMASGLGADVPFFLFGGRAVGVGRGDEIYPLPDGPRRTVLVVSPAAIAVATRDAYQWLSRRLTKRPEASRIWGFCALCWSPQSRTGRYGTQGAALENDFEAAVFERHPRLRRIKRRLLEQGATEAALAGSGSAVFGVFRNPAQARRAARSFPEDQVFVAETVSQEDYRRALKWQAPA